MQSIREVDKAAAKRHGLELVDIEPVLCSTYKYAKCRSYGRFQNI